ncbi:MAG: acetoacetate--CoA ligase [Ignavibacteriales bacterium]|nr:acetoacetate--CoA ligase [Ignavibacteriales bacterium]
MKTPLWRPDAKRAKETNMNKFRLAVNTALRLELNSYYDLYYWSVEYPEMFWEALLRYSGIQFSGSSQPANNGKSMPDTRWFENVQLNFAANLLSRNDDKSAVIYINEYGATICITYKELTSNVCKLRNYLIQKGVKPGDRVAGFVTNSIQSVTAMLATTSLGAIWSSCSPDFGLSGVIDRFSQIGPKVLFAVESYQYGGKKFDCTSTIMEIKESIQSIEETITYNAFDNLFYFSKDHLLLSELPESSVSESAADFPLLPFSHPLYIMYSSGTTGKPKCITHGAGGTLLQHYKELVLHTDLTEHDNIFFFTTCGWMMWNWLISSLMTGATIVLYDGSPGFPDVGALWRMIERLQISIFGTSPKFLSSTEKAGYKPGEQVNLTCLKTILTTGSPLLPQNYQFVYRNIKENVLLSSISGGTDIISCFMLGTPLLPVYEGEIQCRGLGMAVESFDAQGYPVRHDRGELVCTKPAPSMPIFFWNDPGNILYKKTYFYCYPGIWKHGDFIEITDTAGIIVYGRSDSTLNPGGVRIGTAEIYSAIEQLHFIQDSIVVGQNYSGDVRIVLFVHLKAEYELTEAIKKEISGQIRRCATPRHVPAKILSVPDIPRTVSGKKVEIAVSRLMNGLTIDNMDAIANPESLQHFINRTELLEE